MINQNSLLTDIVMALAHFENIDFSDCVFLGEVCFVNVRLFSADIDDFYRKFLSCLLFYTSSHNTAYTSVINSSK